MTNTTSEIVVNWKKVQSNFIGQCAKNPQFLVQTTNKSKIKTEIREMLEDYVKLFPEQKSNILPSKNFKIVLNEQ